MEFVYGNSPTFWQRRLSQNSVGVVAFLQPIKTPSSTVLIWEPLAYLALPSLHPSLNGLTLEICWYPVLASTECGGLLGVKGCRNGP